MAMTPLRQTPMSCYVPISLLQTRDAMALNLLTLRAPLSFLALEPGLVNSCSISVRVASDDLFERQPKIHRILLKRGLIFTNVYEYPSRCPTA